MQSSGGYTEMISYLAEIENTEPKKELRFKNRPVGKSGKLLYQSYNTYAMLNGVRYSCPIKTVIKGGKFILKTTSHTFDIDTVFDEWIVVVRKSEKDFETKPEFVKKVRICEGGGWTSEGLQYRVNDKLFEF